MSLGQAGDGDIESYWAGDFFPCMQLVTPPPGYFPCCDTTINCRRLMLTMMKCGDDNNWDSKTCQLRSKHLPYPRSAKQRLPYPNNVNQRLLCPKNVTQLMAYPDDVPEHLPYPNNMP